MVILIKALKFIGCWTSFGDQRRCHQRYSLFGIEVWNITCQFSLPFPQDKTLLDIYCLWMWHHSLSRLCSLRAYLHQAKLGTKAKKSNDKQRKNDKHQRKFSLSLLLDMNGPLVWKWLSFSSGSIRNAVYLNWQHPHVIEITLFFRETFSNHWKFDWQILIHLSSCENHVILVERF